MLKQRIITGTLLGLTAIAAIIGLPAYALVMVFGAITLAACWEWADLAGVQSRFYRAMYCALSAVGALALAKIGGFRAEANLHGVQFVLAIAALWWLVAFFFVATFPGSSIRWGARWIRLAMGWLALLPAWLAFVFLRLQDNGEWIILFMLSLVAAADIGAYFSGSTFGRRKLAPAVSPGKSWEGFWGGLLASLLLATAVHYLFWRQLPLAGLLLISTVTVLASVLGDLVESMIKRFRGVKDSSNLLPGHGGVMDRLDSITAAAPIFALGLLLAS